MTTNRPILSGEATNLLVRTSTNNANGRIGSPYAVAGYTNAQAVAIIERADHLHLTSRNGFDTLYAHVPGHGWHSWYLNLEPQKADPWA